MPTDFQTGLEWAADMLRTHAGQSVVYTRGPKSITITAIHAGRSQDMVDDQGVVTRTRQHDWLIRQSELEIDGVAISPHKGDLITVGLYQYQVLPDGPNGPEQEMDADGYMLRVKTKQVR